jgi:hypothetical protein
MTDDEILRIVCNFFIESHDFNGIPACRLVDALGTTWSELQVRLTSLVSVDKIDLVFASLHENPHIKRLADLPSDAQVRGLEQESLKGICIYPDSSLVGTRPELARYDDRPYTRRLALVEPQLQAVFFELSVLDKYFRDPRYLCHFGDSEGYISVRDAHYFSDAMPERDKVLLQTFGIGYDAARNRVVAVFLRYLSGLSAEHQQLWKAHEIAGSCTMNSDYERAFIWGMWPEHHSVYQAFIQEQAEINKLSVMIGKPPLFKKSFEGDERPIEFAPMLRPTTRNFREFAHVLDKMLSENIDRNFFKNDIPLKDIEATGDGTSKERNLGTVTLLKRWLTKHYRNRDGEDKAEEVVQPIRSVRKARQPVAHSLSKDEYDQALPRRQDELLGAATITLQKLRLIFSSHPKAKGYCAPSWLDSDKIVFY